MARIFYKDSSIMRKNAIKTRMCVACKGRFHQSELIRLQVKNSEVVAFCGVGRSFYLCDSCVSSKDCAKIISKIFKTKILMTGIQNG